MPVEGHQVIAARTLSELASAIAPAGAATVIGDPAVTVRDITLDSRAVRPGSLFCCVTGGRADGHQFAAAAVQAGAVALVVERSLDLPVPQIVTPSVRRAVGPLSCAVFGQPARRMTMVGVTGTNGKTTVSAMIAAILRGTGQNVGVIGTLTGTHTTPEAPVLQRLLTDFADDGVDAVVMEVSSHALALHRVDGIVFDVAVFTNLGRDHLDLHETIEQYFAAKALLFTSDHAAAGVVNGGDPYGRRLVEDAPIPVRTFTVADATDVTIGVDQVAMTWRGQHVVAPLGGTFNVANALAACTAAETLGHRPEVIATGLAEMPPVPGRFESVRAGQAFHVLVDYAHTPDGLHAALAAVRDAGHVARLIVVFGAGGDRDHDKRPLMGAAAAEHGDVIVVTSDNPRSEVPQRIIADILSGIPQQFAGEVIVEADRRAAFEAAFRVAQPGDVVMIAGKGHETTQTIGDKVFEFDDRAVARQVLEAAR